MPFRTRRPNGSLKAPRFQQYSARWEIANHLDDWVVRLLRLHTMVEKDKFLQERVSNMEGGR